MDESCLIEGGIQADMLLGKWKAAVNAAKSRLEQNTCDFCFKFSEKVHRCGKCLTKAYCGKECLKQDLRMKHEVACKEDSDPRKVKVKEERKVRKEAEKTRVEEQSVRTLNKVDNFIDTSMTGCDHVREELKKITLEAVKE